MGLAPNCPGSDGFRESARSPIRVLRETSLREALRTHKAPRPDSRWDHRMFGATIDAAR